MAHIAFVLNSRILNFVHNFNFPTFEMNICHKPNSDTNKETPNGVKYV